MKLNFAAPIDRFSKYWTPHSNIKVGLLRNELMREFKEIKKVFRTLEKDVFEDTQSPGHFTKDH